MRRVVQGFHYGARLLGHVLHQRIHPPNVLAPHASGTSPNIPHPRKHRHLRRSYGPIPTTVHRLGQHRYLTPTHYSHVYYTTTHTNTHTHTTTHRHGARPWGTAYADSWFPQPGHSNCLRRWPHIHPIRRAKRFLFIKTTTGHTNDPPQLGHRRQDQRQELEDRHSLLLQQQ